MNRQVQELDVRCPPRHLHERCSTQGPENLLENDDPVDPEAAEGVRDGAGLERGTQDLWSRPTGNPDRKRCPARDLRQASSHQIGSTFEGLHQPHQVFRVFGEVALERDDGVPLGVGSPFNRISDQAL